MKRSLLALGTVAVLGLAFQAQAGFITFTDLPNGGDESAIPSGYQPAGLPTGVVATFGAGWLEGPALFEPGLGADDDYYIFVDAGSATITFSEPVLIPSLYLKTDGDTTAVAASLLGSPAWSVGETSFGTWTEITDGAGTPVDTLTFTGQFTGLDAMTVNAVPEPATLAMAGLASGMLLLRRRKA